MSDPTDIKRTAAIRVAIDNYELIRKLPPKERQALVSIFALTWQSGFGAGLDKAVQMIEASKISKAI